MGLAGFHGAWAATGAGKPAWPVLKLSWLVLLQTNRTKPVLLYVHGRKPSKIRD